jgi:hypothetical protein
MGALSAEKLLFLCVSIRPPASALIICTTLRAPFHLKTEPYCRRLDMLAPGSRLVMWSIASTLATRSKYLIIPMVSCASLGSAP